MKVSELIDRLSALDPDLPVMAKTYEGGLHDAQVETEMVALNSIGALYQGPHEKEHLLDRVDKGKYEVVEAVLIL